MTATPNVATYIPGIGAATLRQIDAELARRDPAYFSWWLSNGEYVKTRHIQFLSDRIAKALERGRARLLICAPPRHGKSYLISRSVPAWFLHRNPEKQVILAAYGDTFAETWGRKVRDLLVDQQARVNCTIVRGTDSSMSDWRTTEGGGMFTTGVMGALLGRGAHLLIIDDPCKNAAEAYSPTYQERLRDWYQSTASTRLEPNGNVIVTMQRWPSTDFVSWLIEQGASGREQWDLISLPAIAEADDPMGRLLGEPLWPERFDVAALEKARLALEDPAFWRSQWQQKPPEASTEGLAYHAFSAEHSIRQCVYDPRLPLVWSLDFNVDPMCSVIGQIHENYLTGNKRLEILDEIHLANSNTQAACQAFIAKASTLNYNRMEVIIYGDASGYSRKTTASTDYAIIEQMLTADRRFTFSIRATRKDPAVRDRVTTLNNVFLNASGERRLFIDPRCKELKKDLMFMRWKRDVAGNPLNDLDKSNPMRSHLTDSLGYLTWAEFKVQGNHVGFH